jgi:hypothetical protein
MGFSYSATEKGTVFIEREGQRVTTLRADRAKRFLAMAGSIDQEGQQQLMARATKSESGSPSEPGSRVSRKVKSGH